MDTGFLGPGAKAGGRGWGGVLSNCAEAPLVCDAELTLSLSVLVTLVSRPTGVCRCGCCCCCGPSPLKVEPPREKGRARQGDDGPLWWPRDS